MKGEVMENENENEKDYVEDEDEGGVFDVVYQETNPHPDKPGCISIIARKEGKQCQVYFDYGEDLDEMISLFGEAVVFSNARSKMKIGLQASLRSYMKAGHNIEGLMAKYVPGVALEKVPVDMGKATDNYFAGLSSEEQDAMIARLMEKKGV
jgi:hypothetical protein